MNPFSENEYERLKKDMADVRSCITRYIGYIITATGFSGVIKYFVSSHVTLENTLFLLTTTLVVVSLLFDVIWYKFKSHNRFAGYMQLLMQERAIISRNKLTDNEFKNKDYIKQYSEILKQQEKVTITDLPTWDLMMSRLNNNYILKSNGVRKTTKEDLLKATNRRQFVFSISDRHERSIRIERRDHLFFSKVIWPLYGDHETVTGFDWLWSRVIELPKALAYLLHPNHKQFIDSKGLDQRYIVSGWEYPRIITKIAFSAVFLIFIYYIYLLGANYSLVINQATFDTLDWPATIMTGVVSWFFGRWLLKYVSDLKEVIYGRYSIDAYCWTFFIYRIQLLNSMELIPVYFSRNFLRFFKSRDYYHRISAVLKANTGDKIQINDQSFERALVLRYQKHLEHCSTFEKEIVQLHKLMVAEKNASMGT